MVLKKGSGGVGRVGSPGRRIASLFAGAAGVGTAGWTATVARADVYTWAGNLQPLTTDSPSAAAYRWSATNVSGGVTTTNWVGGVIPSAGADTQLVFSTAAAAQDANHAVNESPYNDLTASGPFTLNRITFGGDPFTLNGGPLAFANSSSAAAPSILLNTSSGQTINEFIYLGNDLTLGGTGTGTVTLAGGITQLAGSVARGVTVNTAGTYVLAGTTAYAGGTTLTAGTLSLGSPSALAGGGPVTFNGGTLQYTAANAVDYSARLAVTAGNSYTIDTNGQAVRFGSPLVGSGGLTKLGGGTLTLANTNGYTGATTLTAGTLSLGNYAALAGGGSVNFNGGTLQYTAANTVDYSARFTAASGGTYSVDTNGQAVTFAAGLAGPGVSLAKLGAGTLTLTGSNTYSGATLVSAGTLAVGGGSLGTPTVGFQVDGPAAGSPQLTVSGGSVSANALTVGNVSAGAVVQSAGSVVVLGSESLAYGTTGDAGSYTLSGGTLNARGAYVGDTGTATFVQTGGTHTVATLNVGYFAGAVGTYNLSGGTLVAGSVVGGKGTSTVNFDGGTLLVNGSTTAFIRGLTAANVLGGGLVIDTNGLSPSVSQPFQHGGTAAVDGGLTKRGTGTLTLTVASTYTGPTNVSAGQLRVNNAAGSGTGSGPVNVLSGATLGGAGFAGNSSTGTLTVTNGGTITAGAATNGIGTLTTGPQAWAGGGTDLAQVDSIAATADRLVMSGLAVSATPASPFVVNVSAVSGTPTYAGTPLVLADDQDASPATNPFASNAVLSSLLLLVSGIQAPSGQTLQLDTQADASGSGFDLVLDATTAAPEPTSLVLAGLGTAPLVLGRRRGV